MELIRRIPVSCLCLCSVSPIISFTLFPNRTIPLSQASTVKSWETDVEKEKLKARSHRSEEADTATKGGDVDAGTEEEDTAENSQTDRHTEEVDEKEEG
jgi:hypothetical protein